MTARALTMMLNLFILAEVINNYDQDQVYENALNIVQYGWKKEALPLVHEKKSLIRRFFDLFFN